MGHISVESWKDVRTRDFRTSIEASQRLSRASEHEAQVLLCLFRAKIIQFAVDGSLFLITSPRNCFDSRDKIFALYPLMQEMVPGICAPDYTKSLDDVIFETCSRIHQYTPDTTWLFMTKWPLRASNVEGALGPSWLPDITAKALQHKGKFRFGLIRNSEDFRILTLGCRFIGKCHPSPVKLGSEPEETIRRIAGLMYSTGEDLHSFAGSETRVRRKENLPERIFNALYTWTRYEIWKILEDLKVLSIFSTIAQYKGIGKLDDIPFTADQRGILPILTYGAKDLANKAFFWTNTGLFGICSDRLREGDTIMISTEFARPFAIRTRPDPSGEPNHYSMVDWVFVDGLEGATMDAEFVNEIRETPLSDIYIH
ncbi:hypothetical protein V2G26_010097 [Clonostachys chloroleuca]